MLEVGLKPGEVPLRFPVAVQNFAGSLLTLRVTRALPWVEWDMLSGQDLRLHLPGGGPDAVESIAGKLMWVKQSGGADSAIFLGVEVTQPTSQVQALLEDRVLRAPRDIKDLWQQWDRMKVKSRRSAAAWLTFLLLGLLLLALGGGILSMGRFPETYGYASLAAGGLLTLVAGFRFWRQHRV